MTAYVDSSVILRLVFGEPNPLVGWTDEQPVSSELLRVECLRVVDRARITEGLDDEVAASLRAEMLQATESIALIPVTRGVLERAAEPFPTLLRTLDAVHLATALAVRQEQPTLSMATHDRELAAAARAVGFPVLGVDQPPSS